MKQIKFSHSYRKFELMEDRKFNLIQIIKINYAELSKEFIGYDTYWCQGLKEGFYELPKTDLIMLIFQEPSTFRIFTTLRRFTQEKYNYYLKSIGECFEIKLEEELI